MMRKSYAMRSFTVCFVRSLLVQQAEEPDSNERNDCYFLKSFSRAGDALAIAGGDPTKPIEIVGRGRSRRRFRPDGADDAGHVWGPQHPADTSID
jgi:hypothetical protein